MPPAGVVVSVVPLTDQVPVSEMLSGEVQLQPPEAAAVHVMPLPMLAT